MDEEEEGVLLGLQQITAVVNNGQKTNELLTSNTTISIAVNNITSDNKLRNNNISDSFADSSELNRREAPLGLSASYGLPLAANSLALIQDTYVPLFSSNIGLPTPVYGVPDAPTNNIIYPGPPPDIPPPIQNLPNLYGPPKDIPGPPVLSLPPPKYGPPPIFNRPLKPPNFPSFNIPKPLYGPPAFGPPKPQYGPPSKPLFLPNKIPKPTYGLPIKLPKPHYGPPKPLYSPPKPLNTYGPPEGYFNGPIKNVYGPPKTVYAPSKGVYIPSPAVQYGPPEPIPHGPPHPGAPAPPTPPDIKYDGWQPIPGLVSRPPSGTYGVPKGQQHGFNDLQFNADFIPPPSGGGGGGGHIHVSGGLSASHQGSSGVSDSYGAPLNTVTGSGGIVTTSGDTLRGNGISSFDFGGSNGHGGNGGNGLSVLKSIGYEILPNSGQVANSYSPNGFYAAAHSYDTNGFSTLSNFDNFASSIASSFDTTLVGNSNAFGHDLSLNVGLIPPSGVYGVPPTGKFGTQLLHSSNKHNSFGLNVNTPKHPVAFREPVPSGLIESIGHSVIQKDAQGIIEGAHSNNFAGSAYVPPPVPDVGDVKPVKEEEPTAPSNLYSLPNINPVSFQSYVHGSSTAGLTGDFSSSLNLNGATASALTSYSAPLGTIDGSYALPQNGGGLAVGLTSPQAGHENFGAINSFDTSHALTDNYALPASLSNTYGTQYFSNYQNVGHDCSQKSHPVPSLSFGVPAANSYTASLASLNTNIAGAYHGPVPSLNYGAPDLQTAHSQSSGSVSEANANALNSVNDKDRQQAELTGKSLASNFGSESELIRSQSLDLNNIPLQGALGSYTLQIQSANGGGGATNVPHDQVLSDGLLQSILNAIEQPQQNTAAILSQPLIHLQQIPPQVNSNHHINVFHQTGTDQNYEDSQAQNSATKNIVVTPPPLQTTIMMTSKVHPRQTVTQRPEGDTDLNLPLIDNNEIALYFSNKAEFPDPKDKHNNKDHQNRRLKEDEKRNGHGSYVSFKTPNSNYVYKNLQSANSTVEKSGKPAEKKT
ncbi:hypothetical protein ILUMI_21208 [Ignelater luminosus]|uniref:Uncharacterized protein n=1 Tax=Ignelater luminosus TaxID=2038154 RepID=A0A8K0CGT9_IGNLU|nr:hypothetical protein ILUMI_21208 [Ignelater luminosus]